MYSVKKEAKKISGPIIFCIVSYLLGAVALAYIPVLNKKLVDVLFSGDYQAEKFIVLIVMYVVLYAFYLLTVWCAEKLSWVMSLRFENMLKKSVFEKLTKLPYSVFSKKSSEEYLSIMTNNIETIEMDYLPPLVNLIFESISIVVYAVLICMYTSPLICASLAALSVLAVFTPGFYKKRLSERRKTYLDERAVYAERLVDLFNGFSLIDRKTACTFCAQNNEFTDKLTEKRRKYGYTKVAGNTFSGGMIMAVDVAVFVLCGILAIKGKITAGVIVAAISYAKSFTDPVEDILYDINTLNGTKEVIKEFEDFQNQTESRKSECRSVPIQKIDVRDVVVSFPEKTLSYNVTIEKGKKYLLTGESGCGKTTLLNVLTGRQPFEGSVLIAGAERMLQPEDCFYLEQNQHVFASSYAENVSLFGAYPEGLTHPLNKAFHPSELKNASDCRLLSGGEQQWMKAIRALSQQKGILLLDEPFSALDSETASRLVKAIESLDSTIVLVTHDESLFDTSVWTTLG